ncbi:MAG: HD domain-containing protein [Candidatus Bathyarchaeota archaeon]
MVAVNNRLIHRHLSDPKISRVYSLLENDVEVQSLLRMANVMAVQRLSYNDHGPTHARITAGSALEIFDLITRAVEPSSVAQSGLSYEDARAAVLCGAYLHDVGNAVHRVGHEAISVYLAAPILDRLLPSLYSEDPGLMYRVKSETLHTIYASDDKVPCLSVEAGIVTVADGTDMAEGRSREPFKGGKNDIHSVSALAIKRVELVRGDLKPVGIRVHMENPAGIFQIEQVIGRKLASSGLRDLIEVSALMNGEEIKTPL